MLKPKRNNRNKCAACKHNFATMQGLTMHRNSCPEINATQEKPKKKKKKRDLVTRILSITRVNEEMPDNPPDSHELCEDVPESQADGAVISTDTAPLSAPAFVPPPTRSGRIRKFPAIFKDFLPNSASRVPHTRVPHMPPPPPPPPPQEVLPVSPELMVHENFDEAPQMPPDTTFVTSPDEFGLYREYTRKPYSEPSEPTSQAGTEKDGNSGCWWKGFNPRKEQGHDPASQSPFAPLSSATSFRILDWFYGGSRQKSQAELDSLVQDVFKAGDFNLEEAQKFNFSHETALLDSVDDPDVPFSNAGIWKASTIKIPMPCERQKFSSEDDARHLRIRGVRHRSICEVMRSAAQDDSAKSWHHIPFKLYWKPTPDSTPQRVVSELYTANAFLEEDQKIAALPLRLADDPADLRPVENAIFAIMLWSDSTHLANFGDALMWPIYFYSGNQSKYPRGRPTQHAAHHIAHIPSLPDNFEDTYMKKYGKPPSKSVLTHMKREIIQKVWELLLDDEFMRAYQYGIVIKCADIIVRRFFPRFFTYSADYPEKVIIAAICQLALCPSPRTLMPKKYISGLGTRVDEQRRQHLRLDDVARRDRVEAARELIFVHGIGVSGAYVEERLQAQSLTPTRSAFSKKLSEFGFNYFDMLVSDLLHEIELGNWKAVFIHLMRILHLVKNAIPTLNKRYRGVPTFGPQTIRRFSTNASEMKKLAARDYEDLLQCALPVFEDLLPPPHNKIVLDLLFTMGAWHACAKLRIQTESTLQFLNGQTRELGAALRLFERKVCAAYQTRELPTEAAARLRRDANTVKEGKVANNNPGKKSKQMKSFNLNTYKIYAMGHYVDDIRQFGTTDNYSTLIGEQEHKKTKSLYGRTNKRKDFVKQATVHYRRGDSLRQIGNRVKANGDSTQSHPQKSQRETSPCIPLDDRDALPSIRPHEHHHVSKSDKVHTNILRFIQKNFLDPAVMNFLPDLKDHILGRLLGLDHDQTFTDDERNRLHIIGNKLYDSINPKTHPDILMLAPTSDEGSHPYLYGRVIAIYHVEVTHSLLSPHVQRIDFIHVRFFKLDQGFTGGFATRRFHRLTFVDSSEADAFGFVDPAQVIRGVHIIPAFAYPTTDGLLGQSIARRYVDAECSNADWEYYYVNMFVDRDMFMRYLGGGIGHRATNHLHISEDTSRQETASGGQGEEELDLTESEEESELEEMASDVDNDYGYNYNKLTERDDFGSDEEEDEYNEGNGSDDCMD